MDPPKKPVRAPSSNSARSLISRTFSRRNLDSSDIGGPKGPLGLTTIYEPDPGILPIVDLIFVHGLNGGSRSTWTKGSDPQNFWPLWLRNINDFQDVRIHTFGYPSGLSVESVLNVRDFAISLLAAIKDAPSINQVDEKDKARLIFVSHSMGGLVVKTAFILGHDEAEFQPVVDRICALFFLGTPHQGAAIAQTLARLMNLPVAPGPKAPQFLNELSPQSPTLQIINEDFPRMCARLQLFSFWETRTMAVGLKQQYIVEKTHAVMNLANERSSYLPANHRNIAKFDTANDPSFLSIRNALAGVIKGIRSNSDSRKFALDLEEQVALNNFLGTHDDGADDLHTLDSNRAYGTCEWLEKKDYYQSWKEGHGSPLLWLRGRPGAGKSTLAAYIIGKLRDTGDNCCYFLFKEGDSTRSTINAFLRSMAWQMARLHSEIFSQLSEHYLRFNRDPIDKVDHNPVWRKVYLSTILKSKVKQPQFWIVDAVDECKGSSELMSILVRLLQYWPVQILVTCRDFPESHIISPIDISSRAISEEDSRTDIALILESALHRPSRTTPSSLSKEITDRVIQNSGGSLLWTSLIVEELRQVHTEREREHVLQTTPSDMDDLYSKILNDMSRAKFGRDLAKAILTWTCHSFRPLTTLEIKEPVEIEIQDKADDIEYSIRTCCGNLIEIDTQGKVHFIHMTLRELLSRKDFESEFVVPKTEAHRKLAKICLEFLIDADSTGPKAKRHNLEPNTRLLTKALPQVALVAPFTRYASQYVFQHLNLIRSTDDEMFILLAKFLKSTSALRWIEHTASHGDLRTVYQAGKIINSLISRRREHSSPMISSQQRDLAILERWGDDLTHLVTKFYSRLRLYPQSIHHHIAPFCPPTSAIKNQFGSSPRGIEIRGLSLDSWDDCLTTILYRRENKPNCVTAGPGYFAVGMLDGGVKIYDDSVFQELHSIVHGEPVWRMAFSNQGDFLASGGGTSICIWCTKSGKKISNHSIESLCLAVGFSDEDSKLIVVTKRNSLLILDLSTGSLCESLHNWTRELPDSYQSRTPTMATLDLSSNLLSIIYRGEDLVLWDYVSECVHDIYEKETGSTRRESQSLKLAEGTTTVRAVALSNSVDAHLLAASYADGDLILYDTVDGDVLASIRSTNASLLEASPDDRTLIAIDSRGNLTLYEFHTLKVLYRVTFETPVPSKGVAFTSDSFRFIEIRGQQCRVWEPTVLLRQDEEEEENSDTNSVATYAQEVAHRTTSASLASITAIASARASSFVLIAKDDGTVHGYDFADDVEIEPLFVQRVGCPIPLMSYEDESGILVCGDLSGRVTARKITRKSALRQRKIWEVDQPVADIRPTEVGILHYALVSATHARLLLCNEHADTLWALPVHDGDSPIHYMKRTGSTHWVPNTSDPNLIVRTNGSEFHVLHWESFDTVYSLPLNTAANIRSMTLLNHPFFFAMATDVGPQSQRTGSSCIQIWDIRSLKNDSNSASPFRTTIGLPAEIELVIGTYGDRLVLFTADCWIASVDLQSDFSTSFVRHFFVPNDWITDTNGLRIGIGRGGEVLFTKRYELAVIKRGLEIAESGTFNPRRSSGQHFRGLPLRRP